MTPEAAIIESMFRIANKDGEDIDFVLNDAQRKLDENLSGRDIIPKARQEGVSSYFLARYTVACMSKRNTRAVVISHEREATERLLNRVHYYIKNMKGKKPVIHNKSKNEITFPKMNSMFYIGTAGSKKFGRGDTITHLHCSEAAYWENASTLLTGLLQAVPASGEIAIESTGNGIGNDYYLRCIRAAEGKSQFICHFLPWHTFPEYTLQLTKIEERMLSTSLREEWNELELSKILLPGQIAWRRMKLEEFNYDVQSFKQEYPMSLDECFQATGRSIFWKVLYTPSDDWKREDRFLDVLSPHPYVNQVYSIGVDVSAGVGRDRSVIQCVEVGSRKQIFEWVDDKTAPDYLAEIVAGLARTFNDAFVTVESNNHGLVTLSKLRDIYPGHLIYEGDGGSQDFDGLMQMGFKTTARTKPLIIGALRMALATDMTIHSPLLKAELDSFVENEHGKLGAQEGCFDDRVMAMAMCNLGIERTGLYAMPSAKGWNESIAGPVPFSFDDIMQRIKKPVHPIFPQHRQQ